MGFIALRGPFGGASYLFLKQNAGQRPVVCSIQTYRTVPDAKFTGTVSVKVVYTRKAEIKEAQVSTYDFNPVNCGR